MMVNEMVFMCIGLAKWCLCVCMLIAMLLNMRTFPPVQFKCIISQMHVSERNNYLIATFDNCLVSGSKGCR